jgi:hypothetical protein
MESVLSFFLMIDDCIRCCVMRVLHMLMHRGWKKSSVLKLACVSAQGLIILGVAFLAFMAPDANVPVTLVTILNVAMIGIYLIHSRLSEAVDDDADPLIARFGWKTKLPMAMLVVTLAVLFFRAPHRVRSAEIPIWVFDLANLGFLLASLLIVSLFYLLEIQPLGHRSSTAKL